MGQTFVAFSEDLNFNCDMYLSISNKTKQNRTKQNKFLQFIPLDFFLNFKEQNNS